jgi:outer membrane protein OmpA-like peptidoglycan-associated protein
VKLAPLELKEAQNTLQRAEALQDENADAARIDHQAYLASQRTRIAQDTASLRAAEQTVKDADAARKEVLLQARTRQAQAAASQMRAAQLQSAALEKRVALLQDALDRAQMRKTDRGYVLTLGADVLFDVDKAKLKPGAELSIAKIADFLREDPSRRIAIEEFTGSTGSDSYNRSLSERRAQAVKAALVTQGIEPSRIETRGCGEAYPIATNATAAGRQLNRRVETVLAADGDSIERRTHWKQREKYDACAA